MPSNNALNALNFVSKLKTKATLHMGQIDSGKCDYRQFGYIKSLNGTYFIFERYRDNVGKEILVNKIVRISDNNQVYYQVRIDE